MGETKVIKLKNGTEEAEILVKATRFSLSKLMRGRPTAFYDLVMRCRDRDYKFFNPQDENQVKRFNLLQENGQPHQSVKNIVLYSVDGEGIDMKLVDPVVGYFG